MTQPGSGGQSGVRSEGGRWMRQTASVGAVLLLLALTVMVWRHEVGLIRETGALELDAWLGEQTYAVRRELESCENVLLAASALAAQSPKIKRSRWAGFVEDLGLPGERGLLGLALVDRVPAERLEWYIGAVREHIGQEFDHRVPAAADGSGIPGWHFIIRYHEPGSINRGAWGLDVSMQPVSRDAYQESLLTGQVRMSEPFELQQLNGSKRPGVVLVAPVGRPAGEPGGKRSVSVGWVAMPIDLWALLDGGPRIAGAIGSLSIVDRSTGRVLCGGVPEGREENDPDSRATIGLAGQTWEVSAWRTEPLDYTLAGVCLAAGVAGSLLTGWMLLLSGRSRERSMRMAEEMTADLRRSEAAQRELARRAESASRLKSEFLANMSHDIRTPMTAILGYTSLLNEELGPDASDSARDLIGAVRRSGAHLLGLINDILDLSKIEAGHLGLVHERVDLGELIAGCADIVRADAERRGLAFSVTVDGPVPAEVLGDETRLRQVLVNILGNASKFTAEGSVTMRVMPNGPSSSPGPAGVRFIVEDTGIGMSEETMGRLFMPFVRGDRAQTRQFEGTGLGLTITKRLVTGMGGEIRVGSSLGVGSRFDIRLPLERVGERTIGSALDLPFAADGLRASGAGPGGDPGQGTHRMRAESRRAPAGGRVLVVEDGEDNQRLIRHVLKRAGLSVEIVGDGESGVARVREGMEHGQAADVVLLDMQLPGIDGYTVAGLLNEMGYGGRVIALTAMAMAGDSERCLAAGCDGYMSKPFDPEELVSLVVESVLSGRAA